MIPRLLHVWTCDTAPDLTFAELLVGNKYVIVLCYNGNVWPVDV